MGKESRYSNTLLSRSAAMVRTVLIKIKMGKMTIQISIKISNKRLNPLNPWIFDSVTPEIKKSATMPPKTKLYDKNHFERNDSLISMENIKNRFLNFFI